MFGGAGGAASGHAGASGSSVGGSGGGGGSGSGGEENPMLHPTGGGTLVHPSSNGSSTLQSSVPSTLQSTQASTLNEVAMNNTSGIPTKFTHDELYNGINSPGGAVTANSDSQATMNQQNSQQFEQNAANADRLRLNQQLQDQINKPQQQIQQNKINTQNKIHQQTDQLLEGSSGEVADSGGSGGES